MKPFPIDELRVEYLRVNHNISLFHCSNDDLNDFLKSDAKKSQEDLIMKYASRNFPPMYLNMYPIVLQMRQEDSERVA
jgi:hypothetical protein